MKRKKLLMVVLSCVLLIAIPCVAQEGILDSVTNGCKTELETHCVGVTPGEGRVLACLYAYGDKISGRCEYALYDAAVQLERAVAALTYMANECADDLDQFCSDVAIGQGRLAECLDKNSEKVSQRCKNAVAEVAIKQ
jgi:hypothetical protein